MQLIDWVNEQTAILLNLGDTIHKDTTVHGSRCRKNVYRHGDSVSINLLAFPIRKPGEITVRRSSGVLNFRT